MHLFMIGESRLGFKARSCLGTTFQSVDPKEIIMAGKNFILFCIACNRFYSSRTVALCFVSLVSAVQERQFEGS